MRDIRGAIDTARLLAFDLVNDSELIAAYDRAHLPGAIWPEVTQGVRDAGYLSMEIWRAADRLFMIAEVAADWPRLLSPDLKAAAERWQTAMERFQKRVPGAGAYEKWLAISRIYSFHEQ